MATLGQSAIFSIHIQAYPEPFQENYKWFYCVNDKCEAVVKNETYNIFSEGLESVMIINNVSSGYFGSYLVNVSNGIGSSLRQNFTLLELGNNNALQF